MICSLLLMLNDGEAGCAAELTLAIATDPDIEARVPICFAGDAAGAASSASAAANVKAQRQVADFLARVLKLAGLRLSDLCDRLNFAPIDRNDVLTQVRITCRAHPWPQKHPSQTCWRCEGPNQPRFECAARSAEGVTA